MEMQKIIWLAQLAWRADNCKITSISCKHSNSCAGSETSTMLVGGTVTLELSKNCDVCFAWRAEQLVAHFESTPGFAYSVDITKGVRLWGWFSWVTTGKLRQNSTTTALFRRSHVTW